MKYKNTVSFSRGKQLEKKAVLDSCICQLRLRNIILKKQIRVRTNRIKYLEKRIKRIRRNSGWDA